MRKRKKSVVLLLTFLLLAAMLAGCASKQCVSCGKSFSSSGHDTASGIVCDDCYRSLTGNTAAKNNNGVWIAVTVMVFIAVFSATSGVVYLVLQRVLPPEPATPRRIRTRDYDYDDFQTAANPAPRTVSSPPRRPVRNSPYRPASNPAPRSSGSDVWVCPRDKSRNSGPFCALCGASRPTTAKRVQADQRTTGNAQGQELDSELLAAIFREAESMPSETNTQRPQTDRQTIREVRNPAPTAGRRAAADSSQRRPVQSSGQQASTLVSQPREAPQRQTSVLVDWDAPTSQEAPKKEYRGAFMRKESVQEQEVEQEMDSELLAAIFRNAAENPEE